MDDVGCDSASQNFLSCSSNGPNAEDCGHTENVLLTCFESGKGFDLLQVFFCPDFLMQFTE